MQKTYEISLDEAVKTLIQLRVNTIFTCREILDGKNVDSNINMLAVNEQIHNDLYNKVVEDIAESEFAVLYLHTQQTTSLYLSKINRLLKEVLDEENS